MSDNLKYLPFVLIGLITLMQLFIYFSARRMRGRSLSELDGLLEKHWLEKERLVIYFSSAYCGPCKVMKPLIDKLASEYDNLARFDAIEHGELANHLGARAAPAFVQVEQGRVVKVHLGALSEAKLRQML
jgi:thioredoxin-like negative regulator of GroEL